MLESQLNPPNFATPSRHVPTGASPQEGARVQSMWQLQVHTTLSDVQHAPQSTACDRTAAAHSIQVLKRDASWQPGSISTHDALSTKSTSLCTLLYAHFPLYSCHTNYG